MHRLLLVPVLYLPLAACGGGGGSDNTGLTAATAFRAVAIDPVTVQLFWNDTNLVERGYSIERASSPFTVVGQVGRNGETFIDSGLEPRKSYRYRVRAFGEGEFSSYSGVLTVTPPLPPLPSLAGVSPDNAYIGSLASVTVQGSGFADFAPGPNTVLFGNEGGTSINVVNDDTLTCDLPTGTPGVLDVAVANLNGSAGLNDGFTMYSFPPVFARAPVAVEHEGFPAVNPQISCEGKNVYATWEELRGFVATEEIWFSRSTDGGANWSVPVQLDGSGTSGTYVANTRMTSEGSNVYVVWEDYRYLNVPDIHINVSTDAGATWSGDVHVGSAIAGATPASRPALAASGDDVVVTWWDGVQGVNREVMLARSTDAGATWEPDARIDTGAPGTYGGATPEIAMANDNVYVVFNPMQMPGSSLVGELWSNRSTDRGATWLAQATSISTADVATPKIAASGDELHIVWETGAEDLYAVSSTDAGESFGAIVPLEESASLLARQVQISAGGGAVHVVYQTEGWVQFHSSFDAGATYSAARRLNPGTLAFAPRMATDGDVVTLTWFENGAVHPHTSLDQGATFSTLGAITPINVRGYGAVCVDGARTYVVYATDLGDIHMTYNRPL